MFLSCSISYGKEALCPSQMDHKTHKVWQEKDTEGHRVLSVCELLLTEKSPMGVSWAAPE